MIYEKFRVLEGINIYDKDPIIYIRINIDEKDKLDIFIDKYIKICSKFHIRTEVNKKIFKNKIELIVKSERLYIARRIIEKLINNELEDEIIIATQRLINNDWSYELKMYADNNGIPYIDINNNEVKLGYGVNGIRILKDEYFEKGELIKEKLKHISEETKGFIPIISVTGTNGKTTTVKLIHNILLELGYSSGLSSTGGIYSKNELIKSGDTTGFYSAREVLKQDDIDVAVLESARGGIFKKGLGYKKAKVAIITSLSEDHIGQDEVNSVEDLLKVKSLLLDEIDKNGIIVVKAIPILYNKVKHKKNVILFDYNKNEIIESHIKNKGTAYYVEGNYIVKNTRGKQEKLVCIRDIEFTFNGISKSNVKNVIAGIIAVLKIHDSVEEVIKATKKIKCDIKTNIGRQNIIDFSYFKLILDYGHNKEAFEEVFSMAKELKGKRIVGVITAAGDREDKYIKELGEVAASYCDYIIIKEHTDKRGRKPGEVSTLLENGAMYNGFEKNKISIELKEEKAIEKMLELANEGDIIVCFSQFLNESLPVINKFRLEKNMNPIEVDFKLYH